MVKKIKNHQAQQIVLNMTKDLPSHGIREHAHQVIHIFELRSETRTYHIITASHALDDLSSDICMRLVGGHVETFTGSNKQVIQEEGSHGTGISRELLRQSQDRSSALPFPRRLLVRMDVVATLLLLQSPEQLLELFGRS